MIILGTNSIKDTGYDVANSCRFDRASSAKLERTPSGAGNRRTFTFSCWFKLGNLPSSQSDYYQIFGGTTGGVNEGLFISDSDQFYLWMENTGALITNQKLRDPSAWYNVIMAVDTTNSTADNRLRLYLNGSEITSFATRSNPTQNYDTAINNTSVQNIGERQNDDYFDGYMAEVVMVDGQQLTPSSFGKFDSNSPTIWKPKDVSGLTFGTNGFYLDFEDSSSLGNDAAGSNNFTANNLAAVDQSTDTPTNNFATLNPLDVFDDDGRTLSEGNLNFATSSGNNGDITGTIAVSGSGKWYFETKVSAQSGTASSSARFGIVGVRDLNKSTPYVAGNAYYMYSDGRKEDGANTTNGAHPGYSTNDIVQVALDLDNARIFFGLNGNWGDNDGNFDETFGDATAFFTSINTDGFWSGYLQKNVTNDNALTLSANFGSPSFSISSGNSDANGYGNFEYAVPSGYYALCTKNLSEFG